MAIINVGTTDDDGNGLALVNAGHIINAFLGGVLSRTDDVGAATASRGNVYIVPASATGAWNGEDNNLAYYDGSAWQFATPDEGAEIYVQDDNERVRFNGSSWAVVTGSGSSTQYAVAQKDTDDTGQNITTAAAVEFDSVTEVNVSGTWAASPNPTRLTVPSGVSHVQIMGNVSLLSLSPSPSSEQFVDVIVQKNGSDTVPVSRNNVVTESTFADVQFFSPILAVSPGDYFEVTLRVQTDTSVTIRGSGRNWMQMEVKG